MCAEKIVEKDTSVRSAVKTLLVDLVKQNEQAMGICAGLKRWLEWSGRGSMTIHNLESLEKVEVTLCNSVKHGHLPRSVYEIGKHDCVRHARTRTALGRVLLR